MARNTTASPSSHYDYDDDDYGYDFYDEAHDFGVGSGKNAGGGGGTSARGGGKNRGSKSACRANKHTSPFSAKHVRRVVGASQ